MLSILLAISVFLFSAYIVQRMRSKSFPPGPVGIPFLGYAPFVDRNAFVTYHNLSKKYGPIFTVQLGTQNWVILNTREVIHEAFAMKGRLTSGRTRSAIIQELSKGLDVAFDDGPSWKSHREFIMKALKLFGKQEFECHVSEEIEHLCQDIAAKDGEAFECQTILSKAIANIACSIIMSRRFSYKDERLDRMVAALSESVSSDSKNHFGVVVVTPFLKHLPPFKESYERTKASFKYLQEVIIRSIVEEHKKSLDNNHKHDFVDLYLNEVRREDSDPSFTEEKLYYTIQDLLVASTDTTTCTLRWCFLALVLHPHYQRRISQEISNVVGCGERVSLVDQEDMPLTRAFLQEVSRCCPAVPLAIPHVTSTKIVLRGHEIPANTPMIANLWGAHRNPEHFFDPGKFRPERHINESGRFVPRETIMPFSIGARRCVGEQLAKVELFLILSAIVQRFELTQVGDAPLESLDDGTMAITYGPKTFLVQFQKR